MSRAAAPPAPQIRVSLALLTAAAFLLGCGGGGGEATEVEAARDAHPTTAAKPRVAKKPPPPLPEVSVSVEGQVGPTDVGLTLAYERGYFTDVGISPFVGAPLRPNLTVSYVLDGTDDIGVASQAQVAIAQAKGAPIVAIGSLVSQPTAALIWLRNSKIGSIAGLKRKTIAIPGVAYQEALLQRALAQGGLTLNDIKLKRVGYKLVPALLNGRADAIFGGSWNVEGIELKMLGNQPVIRRVQDLGIPPYEEAVLIARREELRKEPRLIRKFMSVVARGTRAALNNPAAAVMAVQQASERSPELSPVIAAQARATLPLLSRTGLMSADRGTSVLQWLYGEGLIQDEPAVSQLMTNRFVASP